MFRKLCGDSTLKNVVLVTNMWSEVTPEGGKERENQLSNRFFKPALDLGAQMVRHHRTVESAHDIVRKIMKNHPIALRIQEELKDGKSITETEAGEAVNEELNNQIRKHQAELKGLREEMTQALKEKDEEMRQELEREKAVLEEQIEKIRKDSADMGLKYAEEKKRMEAKFAKMEKEVKERGNVKIPIYR